MTERIIPEPDRYASCPVEGRVLEYYEGDFEAVFILLHPFIRPISIESSRFYPDSYPEKAELLVTCEKVPWSEVMLKGGFSSFAEIDVALRTRILGLKSEYEDKDLAARLDSTTESLGIVPPSEGDLPPLLQNELYEALQGLGYTWLWVGDEFCTERKLRWIDDLKVQDVCRGHKNLFTPDRSVLLTTHWDSHFSFACASREQLETLVSFGSFEGFWCEPQTEVYWSVSQDRGQPHNNRMERTREG